MGLFSPRRPRKYHHEMIYSRKEGEQSDFEHLRGSFANSRRMKRFRSRSGAHRVALRVFVIVIMLLLAFFLMKMPLSLLY